MPTQPTSLKHTWTALTLPPIIFLLAIIAASLSFGAQGQTDPVQISQSVADSMSVILLVIQIALLGLFLWAKRADQLSWRELGWRAAAGQTTWKEALIGAAPGATLGLLYVFALSPLMTVIQDAVGDYVPAGELLPSVGSGIIAFFLANVLFAPFVEENLYRGYALAQLPKRFSQPAAIFISCFFFGLLHWAGGLWYIILTGIVAGGLFAALFIKRGNLIAPFAAHLALNLVEFLFVLLMR